MKLFKNFLQKLVPSPGNQGNLIRLYYQCHRCKEAFELLMRKSYDIQTVYDQKSNVTYLYQKELRDPKCFSDIRIRVGFDRNYNVIEEEIQGGKFLSKEEFDRLKDNTK